MTFNLFQDVKIIKDPANFNTVLFACDEDYFLNFGIFNILSCNKVKLNVHCHIINPGKKTFRQIEKINKLILINFSYSYEYIEKKKLNFYQFKSYLFCARYFIADHIFSFFDTPALYITDADVIFKDNIIFDQLYDLGISYDPQKETLWKQSGGNFVFIRNTQKQFLNRFISEFKKRYLETDWKDFSKYKKIDRANIVGLDQVCLSYVLKKFNYEKQKNFLNIGSETISKNLSSKSKIWSLTGGNQKLSANDKFFEKEFGFTLSNK